MRVETLVLLVEPVTKTSVFLLLEEKIHNLFSDLLRRQVGDVYEMVFESSELLFQEPFSYLIVVLHEVIFLLGILVFCLTLGFIRHSACTTDKNLMVALLFCTADINEHC